ncbi:MAG: glycosyltransferase, partial [Pseudomonadales bacterium]|nr:glycosyltransferase [Pseudomonadales bacterium]
YDVIHAHWIIPQGLVATLVRSIGRFKLAIVVTSHGADLFALNGKILTWLKRKVVKSSDKITVVSSTMKSYCVRELNVSSEKVIVQSMGVDLQNRFTINPAKKRNPFGLVFVGRLVEKKGAKYLIDSLPKVLSRYPQVHLLIIGDGTLEFSLKAQVESLSLMKNVTFLGAMQNSQIPNYLNENSIAVVPSIVEDNGDQEGLGLVIVEAIGCGCTVIASDLPAIRDVVSDGHTGVLVESKSSDALAAAIIKIIENPELQQMIKENAKNYVNDKFDWRGVGQRYNEILSSFPGKSCD